MIKRVIWNYNCSYNKEKTKCEEVRKECDEYDMKQIIMIIAMN